MRTSGFVQRVNCAPNLRANFGNYVWPYWKSFKLRIRHAKSRVTRSRVRTAQHEKHRHKEPAHQTSRLEEIGPTTFGRIPQLVSELPVAFQVKRQRSEWEERVIVSCGSEAQGAADVLSEGRLARNVGDGSASKRKTIVKCVW